MFTCACLLIKVLGVLSSRITAEQGETVRGTPSVLSSRITADSGESVRGTP